MATCTTSSSQKVSRRRILRNDKVDLSSNGFIGNYNLPWILISKTSKEVEGSSGNQQYKQGQRQLWRPCL